MSCLVERLFQGEGEGELDADVWEGPCDLQLARGPPRRRNVNFAFYHFLCLKRPGSQLYSGAAEPEQVWGCVPSIDHFLSPPFLVRLCCSRSPKHPVKTKLIWLTILVQLNCLKCPTVHVRKKHKRSRGLSNSWYIPLYCISVSFMMNQ